MSKIEELISKYKKGKIAPHVYRSDGASRDPECAVSKCEWSWSEHLDPTLLAIVKEAIAERDR